MMSTHYCNHRYIRFHMKWNTMTNNRYRMMKNNRYRMMSNNFHYKWQNIHCHMMSHKKKCNWTRIHRYRMMYSHCCNMSTHCLLQIPCMWSDRKKNNYLNNPDIQFRLVLLHLQYFCLCHMPQNRVLPQFRPTTASPFLPLS